MARTVPASVLTLADAMRDASDGVFVIDRSRRLTYLSEKCAQITGVDSRRALGAPCLCHEMRDCRDEKGRRLSTTSCPVRQILNGESSSVRQRISLPRQDGNRVWIETSYSPIRTATDASVQAVLAIVREIAPPTARPGFCPDASTADRGTSRPHSAGPQSVEKSASLEEKLAALERREILEALHRANGRRSPAARELGISRSKLYRRMEALGIDCDYPRALQNRVSE